MIWIIAGTSEARELISRIGDRDSFIVTIATEEGLEFISSDNVEVGRMNYREMNKFALVNKISIIIDMTHPYARIVSENARKLADEIKIKYIRYIRKKTDRTDKAVYLKDYEEAYKYISELSGTLFFTTGSKNIGDFEKVRGVNRFVYRVLPALESIKICRSYNISLKDIVAVLGPFSKEYNKAMFYEYKASHVIMKDSGEKGGTLEKIKACEELSIIPVIIGREDEEGIKSLGEIEAIVRKEIE